MGSRYFVPVVLVFLLVACNGEQVTQPHAVEYAHKIHPTLAALDNKILKQILEPHNLPNEIQLADVPRDIRPIAGTVSHHLLVGPIIDHWFKLLQERRKIDTFFILSPRHFKQGLYPISITRLDWDAGLTTVKAHK